MTIRTATLADLPYLRDQLLVVQEIHRAAFPHVYRGIAPADAEAFLAERLADSRCFVRVATLEDGRPAGYTVSELQEKPANLFAYGRLNLYLAQIVVEAEHRRRGVGSTLIADVVAIARANNAARVELDVWEFAGSAHAFFARCGFRDLGHRMVYI